ncbi:hypothetical protein HZC31_02980 [Candidatus Woesearchaeota archaeon]|nr:hypothetical protein [Candidatus Woesearchaeota archaeon]
MNNTTDRVHSEQVVEHITTIPSPLFKRKKQPIPKKHLKQHWKQFLSQDKDGNLLVEGISVKELDAKFGAPLYVLIERELRERLRTFKNAFPYQKFRPQFACKVNSNLSIIKIAKEEGFELDASSVGEIILGLLADYEPQQITFTNLYKTYQDIAFAAMIGVQAITTDSMEELKKISLVGRNLDMKIRIFLRINPLIKLGSYSTLKQQYGIPITQAKKAIEFAAADPNIELIGLHFHGSYITNPQVYCIAANRLLKLAAYAQSLGAKISYLDLGGGFPTNENSQPKYGKSYNLQKAGSMIVKTLHKLYEKYGLQAPTLIFEPGKYIVANAMMGLVKVVSTKKMGKENVVITNGSVYNMIADRFVSNCNYELLPANKLNKPLTKKYTVFGSTCDCIDVMAKNRWLPKLEEGDLLSIMDCGAYSVVFASNFNSLKRVPIILVQENGSAKLIRRRDRYAEMFAPELDVLKVADPNELKYFYNLHRINFEKIWGEHLTPEMREKRLQKPLQAILSHIQRSKAQRDSLGV